MSRLTLTSFIDRHRDDILESWADLWNSVQRRRPESQFPDPPYEEVLRHLPYDPSFSPRISETLIAWHNASPVFCIGAAFCQLQAVSASILIKHAYTERADVLARLDRSLEALSLEAGTRRWINTILADSSKQEAVQAERLAVIGQLAVGFAHEIGNPLTAMSAITQVIERNTQDEFTTTQLAHVKKSIDRIAMLVRELVDFSRPAPAVSIPVHVNEILMSAIRLVHYDARSSNIVFSSVLAADLPSVLISQDQLLQVFLNLLINAIDAMPDSGRLETRTWRNDTFLNIAISDTGHGIPDTVMAHIFDPFFTTKPMGKGTGLGLPVSYGIIKKYGGHIEAVNNPETGCTFTVSLPLTPPVVND